MILNSALQGGLKRQLGQDLDHMAAAGRSLQLSFRVLSIYFELSCAKGLILYGLQMTSDQLAKGIGNKSIILQCEKRTWLCRRGVCILAADATPDQHIPAEQHQHQRHRP